MITLQPVNSVATTTVPTMATATTTVPVGLVPNLEIDKTFASNADEDGSGDVSEGDTLTYQITVSSTGTVDLTNVSVIDPLHRPLYVLHPSLAIRAYSGADSEVVEVASLRGPAREWKWPSPFAKR